MAAGKNDGDKAEQKKADGDGATPAELPLFYSNPQTISVESHGDKAISANANYGFAGDTNSVPLTVMEFSRAMRCFPIVFSAADVVVPVAILGLRGSKNQFVSDDGTWRVGTYIPAYVRRYPFILMESPDKLQYTLCIDEVSSHLSDKGQMLFEDGKPSEISKKALEFCSAYQGQHAFTLEFTALLEKYSLLVDNRASITLASGEALSLSGFRVIDEEKFTALPDDVFLEWRERGWIPLIYCHLLSMGNWQALADDIARNDEGAGNAT